MSDPAKSDVQNLLPVQAYFSVTGEFQTFIGQGQPFTATVSPDQSGLHITNSTIDSSVIGGTTPAAGTFTSIAATTGTIATAPTGATDIVNKQYVDYFAAGLSWKQPVVCATTTNISSLSGLLTVDTVTLQDGDRVLVKNQTNKALNGIYVAHSTAWTYAIGADDWNEYLGAVVFIVSGSQKDSAWYSLAQPGGTLGVTDLEFGNFTISAIYTAGTGLTLSGTQFSITNTGATAGTYGSASRTITQTVNAQGQITNIFDQPIDIAASQIGSGTIDTARISGSYTGITGVGTLTAGTWQATPVAVLYGGTGATTAADARTNLSAAKSGANSDITSMSGLTGAITTPESITFDVTPSVVPTAQGALYWDSADSIQTLSLVMEGGNAIQQIGEETYFRIKCSAAITEGQVVMFTGTVGASGGLTGAPATGLTASTASYIMGVATESGALNDWIYVTSFGLVRGIDTTGGAESWVDGQILYYNPSVAGGLTKTLPSAPNAKVQVCAVVHASATGSLFIRPSFGGILGQYEGDVGFTSVAAGDLIRRNAGNTAWENVATIPNSNLANSSITINGSAISLGGSVSVGTVTSVTGTSPVVSSGGATPAISLASGYGDTQNPFASKTANYFLAAPSGSAGAPTFRSIVALDLGTGTASSSTYLRGDLTWQAISSGLSITDNTSSASTFYPALSAVTTGTITGATTSSTKLSFVPDTGILTATGFSGSGASLTALNAANISSGNLAIARFNGGTGASSSTFWRGDGTWATAGSGTVTSVAATAGTGISVSGSPITTSGTLTITNTGVTSVTAGSGISVSASTGGVTISASGGGVTSLNGQTGAITNTSVNAIGSYYYSYNGISTGAPGNTTAGSNLTYYNGSDATGAGLSGTWRFMGCQQDGGSGRQLFVRIS